MQFVPVYHHNGPCPRCGFESPTESYGDQRRRLSNRQRDVLALAAQGYSNTMIAEALGIKEITVKNHMTIAMRKSNARDRTGAVMVALEKGWIKKVERG